MADDSAILSIDFLAGFTIFLIAFIWVATMVPGLFIGLQSNTIDYDAVAYRTGVILAEDPGKPAGLPQDNISWELLPDTNKDGVKRFGLAVAKQAPGVLDQDKVQRFFCTTVFSYPEDYRKRALFGDYPYQFNISLLRSGEAVPLSAGEILPDGYGYIRRDVKIKSASNATIGPDKIQAFRYYNSENVSFHTFAIRINSTELLQDTQRDPRYQINPQHDRITINITGLDTQPARPADPMIVPAKANLTAIGFSKTLLGGTEPQTLIVNDPATYLYVDGAPVSTHPFSDPRPEVKQNISMLFGPAFFKNAASTDTITVSLIFGLDSPQPYLNSTLVQPFDYNYDPANVTQPALRDAVMEVAVW